MNDYLLTIARILAKLDQPNAYVTGVDARKLAALISEVDPKALEGGATDQGQTKEPSNREKIEAAAAETVHIHAALYALRHGMIGTYQEALELMVLSLSKSLKDVMRDLVSAKLAQAPSVYGTNSGHGHVWKRPDGVKTGCGGPMSCGACASDTMIAERAVPGSIMGAPATKEAIDQPNEPRRIEVWCEGYAVTGNAVKAQCLGVYQACSFDDAVEDYLSNVRSRPRTDFTRHGPGNWTYWGCKLFDNEADARKAFG